VVFKICVEVKEDKIFSFECEDGHKAISFECSGDRDLCELLQQILLVQLRLIGFITKIYQTRQENN
jgi:hypothetical protein